jgi:hypothetical protein
LLSFKIASTALTVSRPNYPGALTALLPSCKALGCVSSLAGWSCPPLLLFFPSSILLFIIKQALVLLSKALSIFKNSVMVGVHFSKIKIRLARATMDSTGARTRVSIARERPTRRNLSVDSLHRRINRVLFVMRLSHHRWGKLKTSVELSTRTVHYLVYNDPIQSSR